MTAQSMEDTMTAVLPLIATPAGQSLASGRSRPLLSIWPMTAWHVLAHFLGHLRMQMRLANEPRLTPAMKRDIGLLPEQEIDARGRGIGEVVWRF
jgi:hypothetical protein